MSIALTERETKRMEEEGMLTKTGENDERILWDFVPGSPKYVKCEKCGKLLKTHDGDFSLIHCPVCNLNWISLYGDSEDHFLKTLNLVMKGMATNIKPKEGL